MKSLTIEEKTVGLDTVTRMEGTMDDLEHALYGARVPRELLDDLADLEEDDMDFDGDDSGDEKQETAGDTGKASNIYNTNIHIGISIDVDKPSADSVPKVSIHTNGAGSSDEGEPLVGIVKDSSVTNP